MDHSEQKVFVVYNPKSGNQGQPEELRALLENHFPSPGSSFEVYELTGEDDLNAVCGAACERGATVVVSAGGDGTVVSVANALVNRDVPLGILPLGTGNLLARVLNIPMKMEEAVQLLANDHTTLAIDALKVGEQYFLSNVSVGISPLIMEETSSEQKKRFGMLAYIMTIIKQSRLLNLRRYKLTIDGRSRFVRASEVLVSSTTLLEKPTLLYGPPETLTDGQFEVYLATVRTVGDFLRLFWDLLHGTRNHGAKLYHWESQHSIRIEPQHGRHLVQGDGEVIGHTPVNVEVVPKAIQVIMPKPAEK
jgi:diacylglycerol kinase (ATP)